MARHFFLVILFAFVTTTAASTDNLKYGTPSDDEVIIDRIGYALCYSEDHEQPFWVSYKLTRSEANSKKVTRATAKFTPDPDIESGTAVDADYKGYGYDRGHLAPAADMRWSAEAMNECFYYSNMSPQEPQFNRGIWKKLEETVRDLAVDLTSIYVVTGPVLSDGLPVIGENEVSVPEAYYKCLLFKNGDNTHVLGFLLPNEASDEPMDTFIVPIDMIEDATGLDFFDALPDDVEESVESDIEASWWFD